MEKNAMTLEIPCYMTDSCYRLRASSFMDVAQVMAMEGSRSLGFGYDRLDPLNKAWVLYRMQFKFLRPVMWRDVVTVRTWHKGQDGLVFLRDYEMLGMDGNPSVIGTSSWIVLDTMKRSFVRNENLPEFISADPQCTDSVYDYPAQKVVFPRGNVRRAAGVHTVAYSDVDFVGHANNVKYVAWAMDCIDQETVSSRQVKEVIVNFNNESHLGDVVELFFCAEDGGPERIFYVEGLVEGRQSFAVKLVF